MIRKIFKRAYICYRKNIKKFIPRFFFALLINPISNSINKILWSIKRNNGFIESLRDFFYFKKFFESKTFFEFIFRQNNEKNEEFVDYKSHAEINTKIKTIAYYLPQYHPIKQNDEWWGKGFTEWTNVSKAVPQFIEHYQPKLPGELGFYDLRILDVQRRQIELAKNYGIYGFCFYFYWFGGQRLLEKPLNNFFENKDLDFPFCVNWANENWTRRWDGRENEILMEQSHSPKDDIDFIKEVSVLFKDKRYIRVNGRPLLMIYAPSLLPNAKETAERWRDYCRKNGIGEIYLVFNHTHGSFQEPNEIGFDAAAEFPPHNLGNLPDASNKVRILNKNYKGNIRDYNDILLFNEKRKDHKNIKHKQFRCLCTGWDNEARKPGKGFTFINSSPLLYKKWLNEICEYTNENFEENEKLVFINAWNEWAEGTYLEPDRKFGYAYIQATRDILEKYKI